MLQMGGNFWLTVVRGKKGGSGEASGVGTLEQERGPNDELDKSKDAHGPPPGLCPSAQVSVNTGAQVGWPAGKPAPVPPSLPLPSLLLTKWS